MVDYIILGVVGLLAGICGSLGIGGGFILLIYLTIFTSLEQKVGQLTNLLFFIPIAIIAIIIHSKNDLIKKEVVPSSIIGGIIGIGLGITLSFIMPNQILSKIFAVLLLIIGIKELFFCKKKKQDNK